MDNALSTHVVASPEEGRIVDGRVEGGQWAPGSSGNPKGRPKKGESLSEYLRAGLDDIHPAELELARQKGRPPRTNRELLRERIYTMALIKGDMRALDMLLNRIEGKPRATVEVQGDVTHTHEHNVTPGLSVMFSKIREIREKKQRELEAAQEASRSNGADGPTVVDAEIVQS